MNTPQKGSAPPPATITMRDVYYILFRHKWLIAILSGIGVVGSLATYLLFPFPYTSEAMIFVRYIQETTGPTEVDSAARVKMPDERGNGILNTELQILSSKNLAMQVASNLGPEAVLGKGTGTNFEQRLEAAAFISEGFKAEVQKDCDVIFVQFSAHNPAVVQPVLTELIKDYRNEYFAIHLSPGVSDDFLNSNKDRLKLDLQTAMRTLAETKTKTGITSLDDAKRDAAELIATTMRNIYDTKANLAEIDSAIHDLKERISGTGTNGSGTNGSNDPSAGTAPLPSAEVVAKYQDLVAVYNAARVREQALLSQFTTNNPLVQNAQQQGEVAAANVKKFETDNPGIAALKAGGSGHLSPAEDYQAELQNSLIKQHALTAKYQELTNLLAEAREQVAIVDGAENTIMQETSEKDAAEAKYKRSEMSANQAIIDAAMGSQVSNITPIEAPTPPTRSIKQILKATGGVLGFFLLLAFGLPFFIEMVLDQTLKSPLDVKARIGMPFFITIPRTNGHAKLPKLKGTKQVPLLTAQGNSTPEPASENQLVPVETNGHVAPWDQRHELRPFFETLRDRLMTYFEMINLTHKPKLVAVTSCGAGAGVTTTAAGLASALSEIGEGNVLLVSMNNGDGEAHHFYKGKLACGIEDVLEKKNRDQAQVQDNLFVAKEVESDDRLPRVLPKRFSHLVPMMKASDYDYIIFDMPPVSEISITPRLARFMDMVLLVVESEKTSRDAATRVASLLAESKTDVGLVLNKNRSYLPKRMEQPL
jgi:Mrp family chromosome partitioning ATPase/uncharacterized protein involved in exopolysaccharide biosynthesis